MAIGQGGYKGNLEEIMDALGPQPDQGKFFKDFLDYKQVYNDSLTGKGINAISDVVGPVIAPAGEAVRDYVSQTPEFLSNMKEFWGKAWEPQFEGHVPFLDATGVGAVGDTVLTLGSAFATGAVSGLEGTARGFSLDESGWPTWSGADAADAIEHRAANFPTYHPQSRMGRDTENLIGSFMEGWMGHVADPLGEAVQSVAEFAGVPKESAIKWGGATSGVVSAAPMALPLLKRSRVSSDKPMYSHGYSIKDMRLALEDQIGAVKDFQFMSDAWRKTNPEAWRAALERDAVEPGHFGRQIERMQDVITQDLRDVAFFIDEGGGKGLPREPWGSYLRRRLRSKYNPRGRGEKGRKILLKVLGDESAGTKNTGGYFTTTNKTTGLFQRDATGKMLPNLGRGYPITHPLARQRHVVIGKEGPRARENRWTPKHEWTHALDDILYHRLARDATALDPIKITGDSFLGEMGMIPDYMGRNRWIPNLTKYGGGRSMMSDVSPILKDFSQKIVEVEWQKLVYKERGRIEYEVKNELMERGMPEGRAEQIAKGRADREIKRFERDKNKHIGDKIWGKRSPLELRARLTGINDYLALAKKITYDKLQNPTGTRPFKLEDLWKEDIPYRLVEVRNMIDDLVAYDVMTRAEATAYLKKVLDEVREPYTKLTTELKVGPGPGLINGGEE